MLNHSTKIANNPQTFYMLFFERNIKASSRGDGIILHALKRTENCNKTVIKKALAQRQKIC